MIAAVTLNPCVDLTLFLEELTVGGHNVAGRARQDISGKGVNVNVVLRQLGQETKAVGIEFDRGGTPVGDFLGAAGIPFACVRVHADLRINTKVFDEKQRAMTEINCRGPQLGASCADALLALLRESLPGTDVLVLDGSVPPGIPQDIYRRMAEEAKRQGVRTVLDASGGLLEQGLAACPDLVKPNRLELEQLLGRSIGGIDDAKQACRELIARGAGAVCLSLGREGALLVTGDGAWFSEGLDIEVKSFQGAGDSMVAGLCMAMTERKDGADMLRAGVAAAHGSLLREGTLLCTRAQYDELYPRIPVRAV